MESNVGIVLSCTYWYYMEVFVDEKELGRFALSCHFALDILCDTSVNTSWNSSAFVAHATFPIALCCFNDHGQMDTSLESYLDPTWQQLPESLR